MQIIPYSPKYATEVADLFYASVHAIDDKKYNQHQKNAWAPKPIDYKCWAKRLNQRQPFLALIDQQLAGFIELTVDGYIDCCYTHPVFQGRGVASHLYQYVEQIARNRGYRHLQVDASLIAEPLFSKHGFTRVKVNRVERLGVGLTNINMQKQLTNCGGKKP